MATTEIPRDREGEALAERFPGRFRLTSRELDILRCAARGLSGDETARELWLAPQTVKFHKTNLYRKLGVKSIGQAVAVGYQRGILLLEGAQTPPLEVVINGVRYVREEHG